MAKDSSVRISLVAESLGEKDFCKRECVRMITAPGNVDRCGCGLTASEHHPLVETEKGPSAKERWSIAKHTRAFPTDAYGSIEFLGGPHPHKAHFVRLAFDSKPQDVLRLLEERWKLGRPKLVISIYGSLEDFKLQPKLAKEFSKGLVKTVKTTDAWIICNGFDAGVSKLVASAFASASTRRVKRKAVIIGIAPWGMLKNREEFILSTSSKSGERTPDGSDGIIVPYNSRGGGVSSLSSTFTHFLLVDNGTVNRCGAEIVLRRRLEEFIRQQILIEATHQRVPVVGVLLNGGIASLRRIIDCVTNTPALPVVVFCGTGGAADVLASSDVYWCNKNSESAEQHKSQILTRIRADFKMEDLQQAKLIFQMIMVGVSYRKEMNIFRAEDPKQEFDTVLLCAYLNAQQKRPMGDRLALMLTWNRADVASKYVFSNNTRLDPAIMEASMMEALIKDRVEFVQLLLDNKFAMQKFLTPERLEHLYNKTDKARILLTAMEEVTRDARYPGYRYTLLHIGYVMTRLMGGAYDESYYRQGKISPQPFNDLFVWAILTKRHSMALCMWRNGIEAMAKALVAIKLYTSLSKEAAETPNAEEICAEFGNYAEDFRRRSLQLLSQCCTKDDDITLQVLTRELPNWGNETCISLAVRAKHKDFVAHPACQMLLNDLWQGGLQVRKRLTALVLLPLVFPPAIFCLDFKTKEELQLQAQRGEEVKAADSRIRISSLRRTPLSIIEKVREYYAAPISKFWAWTMSYLLFLGVYTMFVLLKTPEKFGVWEECYLVAYAIVVGCDLLRQALMGAPRQLRHKFVVFARRKWNLFLSLAVLTLLAATSLRFVGSSVEVVRLVYVCNIMIWYGRVLDIMGIHKLLGPYIIMFGKTLLSFLYLSTIFAVLLTAYGITVQSILNPQQDKWEWHLLKDVVFQPYFMMFGEVFAPTIDKCGDASEKNETSEACIDGHWVKPVWMSIYLLVMNTLLLNLLIATFTNIFTSVNASSQTIWRYTRYNRIMEYEQKPFLPPPFTTISHLIIIVKYLLHRYWRRADRRAFDQALKLVLIEEQTKVLLRFESEAMMEMNAANATETSNSVEEVLAKADKTSELLEMKVNDVIARDALFRHLISIADFHLNQMEKEIKDRAK